MYFCRRTRKAASIDCLIKNDAAVVAKSNDEIYEKLNLLINDKELIDEYSEKAWEYGKRSFDRVNIQMLLKESIKKSCKEGKECPYIY